MELEILTPTGSVFSGKVKLIKVPGSSGSFEVLKNHAPIISVLTEGELKVVTQDEETLRYKISAGVIEVMSNKIIVLAESILK